MSASEDEIKKTRVMSKTKKIKESMKSLSTLSDDLRLDISRYEDIIKKIDNSWISNEHKNMLFSIIVESTTKKSNLEICKDKKNLESLDKFVKKICDSYTVPSHYKQATDKILFNFLGLEKTPTPFILFNILELINNKIKKMDIGISDIAKKLLGSPDEKKPKDKFDKFTTYISTILDYFNVFTENENFEKALYL